MTDVEQLTRLAAMAKQAAILSPILDRARTAIAMTRREKQELSAAVAYLERILAARRESQEETLGGLSSTKESEALAEYLLIQKAYLAAIPTTSVPGLILSRSEADVEAFIIATRDELVETRTQRGLGVTPRSSKGAWLFGAILAYANREGETITADNSTAEGEESDNG